jgi:DNA polymerase-3 subunit gamma/tau
MASLSLYRKWRSQTFSDLVGQEPVIRTLRNALNTGNLAHAYLFAGPRGTGKTSMARLLAKTINCLQPEDGEPCNECQQCREITAGNSFNVIEIDAASNRGIDSIRELREKVMVPPSTGKYKVYILDEAHMLTVEAFNALLKTLEEPPPHAIFVMATTDVHKMLPTVLSRCQRFDFKRFSMRQLVERLNYIAGQEEVKLEGGAAELIARAAAGGMRDAISLLDQAIAYSGYEISLTQVQTMLGVADPRAIQKLVLSIATLDSAGGLHLIYELAEAGADLRQINNQVAEYWRAMMLTKAGANIAEILDCTDDEVREIKEAAGQFSLEVLIECARVFAQNELMQKNQGTPQLGLELAFLSCVALQRSKQGGQYTSGDAYAPAMQPVQPASAPPARIAPAQPLSAAPVLPSRPQSAQVNVREDSSPPTKISPSIVEENEETISPARKEALSPVGSTPSSGEPTSLAQSEQGAFSLNIEQVNEKWELIKRRVRTKKDGAIVAALLKDYTPAGVEGTGELPVVVIKANSEFHYKTIQRSEDYQKLIEWAIKLELGQTCRLRLLSPSQTFTFSPPPPPGSNNHVANTMIAIAPQPSAHMERSTRPATLPPPPPPVEVKPANEPKPSAILVSLPEEETNSPLARTGVVRENSTVISLDAERKVALGESRKATVERKAKSDPVVQEVMRIFRAQVQDVHLK